MWGHFEEKDFYLHKQLKCNFMDTVQYIDGVAQTPVLPTWMNVKLNGGDPSWEVSSDGVLTLNTGVSALTNTTVLQVPNLKVADLAKVELWLEDVYASVDNSVAPYSVGWYVDANDQVRIKTTGSTFVLYAYAGGVGATKTITGIVLSKPFRLGIAVTPTYTDFFIEYDSYRLTVDTSTLDIQAFNAVGTNNLDLDRSMSISGVTMNFFKARP